MKLVLLCFILTMARANAAPVDPGAARLFERATRVYGTAKTLSLDYRVTCDAPALQMEESGRVCWKPGFYAQEFRYARGRGHFAADADTVYFTRTDGASGRYAWKSFFGFWNSLPWPVPGHLAQLLRGQKLLGGAGRTKVLPAQTIEGVPCDGVWVDLGAGQDKFRLWFARRDGTLRRESWLVVLPDIGQTVWVQTRYSALHIGAPLERADFITPAEVAAPLVDPDALGAP